MANDELSYMQFTDLSDLIRAIRRMATDSSTSLTIRSAVLGLLHAEIALIRDDIKRHELLGIVTQTEGRPPVLNALMASVYIARAAASPMRDEAITALRYVQQLLERDLAELMGEGPKAH